MKDHPPLLTVVTGRTRTDEDEQERAAWAVIAGACESALTELHPHHPERQAFLEMWAECRSAAGLPCVPGLRQTA